MRRWYDWCKAHVWGLLVGTMVTLASVNLYVAGVVDDLSLALLDYHFKHFNSVIAQDDIVMIDIDDDTVGRLGWPWPRRSYADLIDTLRSLGTKAVVMDLVFDQPAPLRIDDPRLRADYGVDHVGELIGGDTFPTPVDDDGEFAAALSNAGNVHIGMFGMMYHPRYFPDAIREQVIRALDADPDITFGDFQSGIGKALAAVMRFATDGRRDELKINSEVLFHNLRIQRLIEQRFDLTEEQVAERLGLQTRLREVANYVATAKRVVAKRAVADYRREHPDADWPAVYAHFCPDKPINVYTADRADLLRAFRAATSELTVFERSIPVPDSLVSHIRTMSDETFPVDKFTKAAKTGVVSFQADSDGVVRRIPLVVNASGHMLKHIGFAVACDVLGIDETSIAFDEDQHLLTMASLDGQRRWHIQIDDQGRTLINWHPAEEGWQHSFKHIKMARVMAIPEARRNIEENEGREAIRLGQYVYTRHHDTPQPYNDYAKLVQQRKILRWREDPSSPSPELAQLEKRIGDIERESIAVVLEGANAIKAELNGDPDSAELDDLARTFLRLAEEHESDKQSATIAAANDGIRRKIAESQRELRHAIQGKICLVGYTAAALADTANSPVFNEMPGVMAHANVINSMIGSMSGGGFPWVQPRWVNILLIVLSGSIVTVVTSWRDPWISLVSMLLVVFVLLAVTATSFYARLIYFDATGAFICAFLTWAFVTLYRQLTEERQKRAFSKSLAQYTSPAIAAQLADKLARRSGDMNLAPQAREVTCFFSDLKGFTSISERLGAARTREILNPYLEAMSEVLIEYNGMINKFMGDGIFAFFNPPIHPVDNHAKAACEATLESFTALERLKERIAHGDIEEEARALSMRIGVNSGEVFVGDYGSSSKLDYTCIGDTVNLAARLEPACKVFGIQSLISESTRVAAGDGFVVRHLGALQVVGKEQAVSVYELIGRCGEVDDEQLDYIARFGDAVERFQHRDWEIALKLFEHCQTKRPNDLAVKLFIDNIHDYQQTPPPDDWNRAIRLTSK